MIPAVEIDIELSIAVYGIHLHFPDAIGAI